MDVENKVSKICWNSEGWKFPSGSKGKSVNPQVFEGKTGYGHEEWLFNKSTIIDGYKYAFLQPLGLKSNKHVNTFYNISLFTVTNGKRYFVGEIKNTQCISKDKSKEIYQIYKQKGWLKQMAKQIERAGANPKMFRASLPEFFSNIRFKFKDVNRPEELEQISEKDVNITTNHYKLLPKKRDFLIKTEPEELEEESEGKLKKIVKRKRIYKGEGEFDPYHDKMQNAIYKLLRDSYKNEYKKVLIERDRVDVKAKTYKDKWHYFEIKTDEPRLSIRNAIGQIMEYSYWPEVDRAEKLIVISDSEPNLETQKYLAYLRKKFNIPISYRFFNFDANALSKDY